MTLGFSRLIRFPFSALGRLVVLASLALATVVLIPNDVRGQSNPSKPLKVLLVTGGCCHDYTNQKNLIKEGLEARANFQVTVVQQGGSGTYAKIKLYEDPGWADEYDVVIHDECFADVKDTAWIQRILSPHQGGKPAVVIHCAMHCYRDGTDNWFKFCGVTSRGHGAHYAHEVLNRDGEHPIMKGWGAAWANPAGELYDIEKIWPTAHPLASAKDRANGKEQVCVWTNQYGKARVFGTTLGHHNETVSHPRFLDLLTRGVLWACGKLNADFTIKPPEPATKQLVPENLALNQSVTVSSVQDGHPNHHAVDGNPSTRWCASDASAPQWIQVDLGATKQVTGCQLTWEYGTRSIYKYVLEGSTDGKNWKTLVDYSQNESRDYDHKFDDKLRYVKVRFQGASQGCWCSLWEFNVHGTQMVPTPPVYRSKPLATNLQLPAGVKGKVFAAPPAVNYPVSVCASPDGIVYVCVDKNGSLDREANRGAIIRLQDIDGDGEADESKLFVDNVDSPRCAVWDHDRLYVMHPPHLSAFIDHDGDGHADEQKVLIKNIAFGFKDRPADHTSNGVTLGIDGWLYLAIGDFGFMDAEGTDGRHLQFRSGGVIRVRPDGSGMEVYSRGTRNILEVAMDPLLNGFTRDNTNDGGGWDIRIHHFSGLEHHGYPSLYMNFNEEIVAPLADYGGGSGCGALFLDEPGYPESLTNVLCTADWGRSFIYTHRLKPNGATFSVDQEPLASIERVTDLDVDANSNIYAASWKGATFRYEGDEVGYIVKLQPEGYEPPPLPNFKNASVADLLTTLESPSHRRRLAAQRALIRRGPNEEATAGLERLAANKSTRLASRVAAIFGLKQSLGKQSHPTLQRLAQNHSDLRAWAIRALADRWDELEDASVASIRLGLGSDDPRVLLESIVAAARQGRAELAEDVAESLDHKDPLIAHTAVQSLVQLKASPAAFAILDDSSRSAKHAAALRVLHSLHEPAVVDGLIERLNRNETSPQHRMSLIKALCRLCNLEGKWKGNSWGTRPDTSGPYYQPEEWAESAKIKAALTNELESAAGESIPQFITMLTSHKVSIPKATEVLLASADSQPGLLPIAIDQLRQSRKLGDSETQFLKNVVSKETNSLDLRSRATQVLIRSGDKDAWQIALAQANALTKEHGENARPARDLRGAFLRSRQLDKHIPQLNETAAKTDGTSSLWAELALINLSKSENDTVRTEALSLIESGWKVEKRREQILKAIPIVDAKHFEGKVREALNDPSGAVASAARIIAARWKLEPEPTPAGPQIKSLSFDDVMAAVASNPGDPKQGALVYARLDCKKCHTVEKGEALRGPYLPNVAKTYKRDQIAEAILKPSKSLAQGFVTTLFYLDNGKTATGFITQESAKEVVYRDAEGEKHRLASDKIEERIKQKISMMPEGQANELTVDEFASLVTYLQSLGK